MLPVETNINSREMCPAVLVEERATNVLPVELIPSILSFLDPMSLQVIVSINQLWRVTTIQYAKITEFSLVDRFTGFLREKLCFSALLSDESSYLRDDSSSSETSSDEELYFSQQRLLSKISASDNLKQHQTLIDVKLSILALKQRQLDALKDVLPEHLETLQLLSKNHVLPHFFGNFFDLATIYEKINHAIQKPDDESKKNALLKIIRQIFQKNRHIDQTILAKIITAADTIMDDQEKSHVLYQLCTILTDEGDIDEAVKIAHTIPDDELASDAFCYIVESLASENMNKGIKIIETILGDGIKSDALITMAKKVIPKENINWRIIQDLFLVVNTIAEDDIRENTLSAILKELN